MIKIPFCPNPACPFHTAPPGERWFSSYGFYPTKAFGRVARFICMQCGQSFSTQTFSVHYYAKKRVRLRELFFRHAEGQSGRAISRALHLSPDSVQNRLDRLARQSLDTHARLRPLSSRQDDLCIDGFVSFDRSQYFPNEITISLTAHSQYIIEASHASRKRSGSMRPAQKEKAATLYATTRFERGAVSRAFRDQLDTLALLRPPTPQAPLVIITDDKPEYRTVLVHHQLFLSQDDSHRIAHLRIRSTLPRTRTNPLFASNYIDRELRKDQANHHRETVCFTRNIANGLSRLACYIAYHNYFKPFRISSKLRLAATHAEAAGIDPDRVIQLSRTMFEERAFLSRIRLSPPLDRMWRKLAATPCTSGVVYLPHYAIA